MPDANQDPLSGSQMAYFRVKRTSLPPAYRRFLEERLEPGAPVMVAQDASTWPVTRVGDRHVFQVGAQGGTTPEGDLDAPAVPAPEETAAEAEWGFAAPLLDAPREAAGRTGHPVVELRYGHPQHPAAAVADVLRTWSWTWTRRRGGARRGGCWELVHPPRPVADDRDGIRAVLDLLLRPVGRPRRSVRPRRPPLAPIPADPPIGLSSGVPYLTFLP